MAFLDNSGDIILDAVLTDTGRFRLAKGDGSFKIAKFALGDEEIDYNLYNKTHASGSAYYDLEILQTPVLEAFTNNMSSMKSKLVSYNTNSLLYLPVLKVNTFANNNSSPATEAGEVGAYVVAVDTTLNNKAGIPKTTVGYMNGITPSRTKTRIRIDQGLDTTDLSPQTQIPPDRYETQYIIEMDYRLGRPVAINSNSDVAPVSFIDDDNIASYYVTTDNANFVQGIPTTAVNESQEDHVIAGPRGSMIQFKIASTIDLQSSDFLFDQIGGSATTTFATFTCKYIDTVIRVTGATTGYRLDIPVRFIKKST